MNLYIIRHKVTNQIMPEMKRGKGYSHWNPGTGAVPSSVEKDSIRIFYSERQAKQAVSAWASMPNCSVYYYNDGDDDYRFKDDGRKKEDLEVVECELIIKS